MGRQQQQKPEPVQADPLADLRADIVPGNATVEGIAPEEAEAIVIRPMVDQGTHDDMVAEVVASWHNDPTSIGFLHSGGSHCGCRYIARQALLAAVPVMTEEDMEERELEPSDG